jgi:hypothetical protein
MGRGGAQDWDRTVRCAGRPGDEQRAVRLGAAGFWIVDNGSSHAGQRSVDRMRQVADLDALAARLTAFEPRYNATATPFDWHFTRADLTAMLSRIDAHRPAELACAAPAA